MLQSQDNGLLTRNRVHPVDIKKDVFWQKTSLTYLKGLKGILKLKEEIILVKPKPDI